MQMSRQWMYGDRCHPDFIKGMHYFLNVAEANSRSNGFIYCPCSSCKNMKDYLPQIPFTSTCWRTVSCLAIIVEPSTEKVGLYWKTTKKKRIVTTILFSLKTVIVEWGKTNLKKSPFLMSRFLLPPT